MEFNLLGKSVQLLARPDVADHQKPIILQRIKAFVQITNANAQVLSPEQQQVFKLTDAVVVFTSVKFGKYTITRSFMDQPNARFYWATDDLLDVGYSPPNRIPTFYYHDAFHILQWLTGNRAADLDSRVDREIEATDRQLEVAVQLQVDSTLISELTKYRNDRGAIEARLSAGVDAFGLEALGKGSPFDDHFPILDKVPDAFAAEATPWEDD